MAQRVIEITSPWTRAAGRFLVGVGHEVVLVEPPGGLPERAERDGIPFAHWHAGKRSTVVEVGDHDTLAELCANADVLLDGRLPGTETPNFEVPTVRVTPFGSTGPAAHRAATDLTIAARGGMLSRVGSPDSAPLRMPQHQAEQLAGVYAALAVEVQARRVAVGQPTSPIDLAAVECVAACLETGTLSYLHCDRVDPRPGRFHPLVPHGLFRTRDGYAGGGLGGNQRMWTTTVEWLTSLGRAGGLADPRWASAAERKAHRFELFAELDAVLADWPVQEWVEQAQERRLPWAVVDGAEGVRDNPQLQSRSFFVSTRDGEGHVNDLGFGFRLTEGTPAHLDVPPVGDFNAAAPGRDASTEAPEGASSPDPLSGIRVVDLTWVLAGPYCTRVLADLGAEVIKVESNARPDPTRFNPDMHLSRGSDDDPNTSGYFNEYNRNKRSITLDTRSPEGKAVLRDLIASADVLVENFSASVMTKMSLGWAELQELNPRLVYLSMSGMGHTGPRSSWVSYADIVSAAGGLSGLTGWSAEEVVGVIYGHGDIVAGLQGALSVLGALRQRSVHGRGQHIDLSQLEATASHMGTILFDLAEDPNHPPVPIGNADLDVAPHGVFKAAGPDEWVAIAVTDTSQWQALCQVISRADLVELGSTVEARRVPEVAEAIATWARVLPPELAVADLQAAGVPAEVVQDARRLVADTQLQHRGFLQSVDHPLGRHLTEGSPLMLTGLGRGAAKPAPLLGADTDEVLAELGYDAEFRDRLRATDVLS